MIAFYILNATSRRYILSSDEIDKRRIFITEIILYKSLFLLNKYFTIKNLKLDIQCVLKLKKNMKYLKSKITFLLLNVIKCHPIKESTCLNKVYVFLRNNYFGQ